MLSGSHLTTIMKLTHILPLATLSTAFVIPDEQVMGEVAVESYRPTDSFVDKLPSKDQFIADFEDPLSNAVHCSKSAVDDAIETAIEASNDFYHAAEEAAFDSKSWLDTAFIDNEDHDHRGHHGHRKHPHKPNMTVYELIAGSKYTTKLAKLIDEFPDLVQLLNGTAANYTVFAPTDSAFEKIPEHAPKPSKEMLKKVLTYHVSSDFYPAGRVLVTHTVPTLLKAEALGDESQRLSTNIGLKGLTVNFYSRIVAVDIVSHTIALYIDYNR